MIDTKLTCTDNIYPNFIAGKWVNSSDYLDVLDPSTAKCFAKISMAGIHDMNSAVTSAREVHESRILYEMPPYKRSLMLNNIADALEELKPDGSEILSLESGKRLNDAEVEFDEAIRYFRYYAGMADKLEGRSIPLGKGYINYTTQIPYGVTAHIVPWNFPISIAARSLAPALAAANTAIVKLSELTPLAALMLGKACEMARVPEGAVSILCGTGPEIGNALTLHKDVQQVVFTGSVTVGQKVLENLAKSAKPSVTELGGKSAAIVVDDADLDCLLENIYWGIYFNAGQVCSAMSRLIVPRDLQEEITQRITKLIGSFSIGNGIENNDVTPLVSQIQLERVLSHVSTAVSQGATLVCGGNKIGRDGYFFEPTLISNVTVEMSIAKDEVFGPVLAVMPYDNLQEALAIANGTDYGLAAGVFSQNIDKIGWLSDRLIAGQIYINEWYAGGVETPFGGMKLSGNGREKGQEAIFNYLQTKNIAIRLK